MVEARAGAFVVGPVAAAAVDFKQLQIRQRAAAAGLPHVLDKQFDGCVVLPQHNKEIGLLLQVDKFFDRHVARRVAVGLHASRQRLGAQHGALGGMGGRQRQCSLRFGPRVRRRLRRPGRRGAGPTGHRDRHLQIRGDERYRRGRRFAGRGLHRADWRCAAGSLAPGGVARAVRSRKAQRQPARHRGEQAHQRQQRPLPAAGAVGLGQAFAQRAGQVAAGLRVAAQLIDVALQLSNALARCRCSRGRLARRRGGLRHRVQGLLDTVGLGHRERRQRQVQAQAGYWRLRALRAACSARRRGGNATQAAGRRGAANAALGLRLDARHAAGQGFGHRGHGRKRSACAATRSWHVAAGIGIGRQSGKGRCGHLRRVGRRVGQHNEAARKFGGAAGLQQHADDGFVHDHGREHAHPRRFAARAFQRGLHHAGGQAAVANRDLGAQAIGSEGFAGFQAHRHREVQRLAEHSSAAAGPEASGQRCAGCDGGGSHRDRRQPGPFFEHAREGEQAKKSQNYSSTRHPAPSRQARRHGAGFVAPCTVARLHRRPWPARGLGDTPRFRNPASAAPAGAAALAR